jgi:hypothetical protein
VRWFGAAASCWLGWTSRCARCAANTAEATLGEMSVAIARRNEPVLQMKTGFARYRHAGDATFIETIGTA